MYNNSYVLALSYAAVN